ncbi:hypothetical protein CVT25_009241 [Psilocybe cyanescens]|uniref:Uncharacterized protein n=1 Tax=Psilocybe cyanescens TaxID=93625 RepID=A0A409XTS0_PSICY|nr:hypothetical protein CVT25_009241 [Psilocybe cyanescens]
MTISNQLTALLFFVSLLSSANAQINNHNRPRRSWGRVVAGVIIGGVAGLILLCLMLRMMQRRRFARAHPGAQPNFFAGKPMFGGPWGHSNAPVSPQPASQFNNGGPGYSNYNPSNSFHSPQNALQSPALAANPEYPAPNGPLPPPAYGQDANYEGKYAPPSGPPPPVNMRTNSNYSPPPGPPPAAHTTGQDNSPFIGGFRS